MLVLEGGRGRSGRSPGTDVFPFSSTQRPDPQILASRDLGNGSTAVCDTGPVGLGGGVPGFNPPDFHAGQDVTDALRDLMCRFFVLRSSTSACTFDSFGTSTFLGGSASARQFCYPVSQNVVFPPGQTILAAQLRDVNGNLGPRVEIVIDVVTP